MRDTHERLNDIQEAIIAIEKYTGQGREAFMSMDLVQVWVLHHLQIIGEVASTLPKDFRDAHPEIPWRRMSNMRNNIIHEYFGIDLEIVWDIVENHLPPLKAQIDAILSTG